MAELLTLVPQQQTLIAVCETETSSPAVLDDVPNCEIEQTEVCNVNAGGVQVCRTVPQQKCSISQQGYIQCGREIDSHRLLLLGSCRISHAKSCTGHPYMAHTWLREKLQAN